MAEGRHSYVAFYASDWSAGTARMPRIHRSVYHDICVYIWDYARPVPVAELGMMLGDLADWHRYVDDLIGAGKLQRLEDGSIVNRKALAEAEKALALWEKKSGGGRKGAGKTNDKRWGSIDSDDKSAVGTPDNSGVGSPSQNQNQNQNQNQQGEGASRPSSPGRQVLAAWNEMAKAAGLRCVSGKVITSRAAAIRARISEHGADAICAAIGTIPRSTFLMGSNDRGWSANLDDLMRPKNMQKLIDGNYHTEAERMVAKPVSREDRAASLEKTIALYRRMGRNEDADEAQRQLEAMQ